jgi:nucleotide-binding universal stress UspA family protein
MFGTILLAVDGSEQSDKAVELAARLAAETRDEVVVTHVIELLPSKVGATELELREARRSWSSATPRSWRRPA